MPENGNPCASIVVEGCPSQKKRDFWVPKKNAIFGSQFLEGERLCPQLTLGVHTISNLPTNRVKWRAAL